MKIETYTFCFIAGLLGILAHILFVKLPALKAASKVGNAPFSVKGYFQEDWLAIAGSLLTVIIFMFVLNEIVSFYPNVEKGVKWCFLFAGYTGSSLLQALIGKTAAKINQVIDIKTDIADKVS